MNDDYSVTEYKIPKTTWEYKSINFYQLPEEVSAEAEIKFPLRELEVEYSMRKALPHERMCAGGLGIETNPYTEEEEKIANQKTEWEQAEVHKRKEDKLNELGRQGWELFQEDLGEYTFKRKKLVYDSDD